MSHRPISIPLTLRAARLGALCVGLGALTWCSGFSSPSARPAPGVHRPDASAPFRIELTGSEDRWELHYPEAGGRVVESGNAMTTLEIRVPFGCDVLLALHSSDYVYTLELPELKLKEIAVPGLEFTLPLGRRRLGNYELRGDHLCGVGDEEVKGTLRVESLAAFRSWLRERVTTPRASL